MWQTADPAIQLGGGRYTLREPTMGIWGAEPPAGSGAGAEQSQGSRAKLKDIHFFDACPKEGEI